MATTIAIFGSPLPDFLGVEPYMSLCVPYNDSQFNPCLLLGEQKDLAVPRLSGRDCTTRAHSEPSPQQKAALSLFLTQHMTCATVQGPLLPRLTPWMSTGYNTKMPDRMSPRGCYLCTPSRDRRFGPKATIKAMPVPVTIK